MRLTLNYCSIVDVLPSTPKKDDEQKKDKIVKINIDEENFFEMLDNINPKLLIKYLDMRFINHRDAPVINIYECQKQETGKRNKKKLNRCLNMLDSIKNKEKL